MQVDNKTVGKDQLGHQPTGSKNGFGRWQRVKHCAAEIIDMFE